MSNKYQTSNRCYLIDHHSPQPPIVPLNNLNIEEYEQFFDIAHIDSLMVYCKDHWGVSYYDTKVEGAVKHEGIKNDWIKQVSASLKKKNIEFIAYYCIEYDEGAARRFPEWRVRKADGSHLIRDDLYAKWSLCCYQTGYRKYCLDQLSEIVSNYNPDAIFMDIFGASLCYCDACKAKFKLQFGYDIPSADDDILAHKSDIIAFLDGNAEEFLKEVNSTLKAIDSSIAITVNFACHYPKYIRDMLDYQFSEPLMKDNWFSSAYARDTATCQYPILAPGEASQVYNYDSTNQYICDLSSIAAQGCRVGMYSGSQHIDGTLDFEEARRLGAVYAELKKMEPYLTNRTPVKSVGILQSDVSKVVNLPHFNPDAILRMKLHNPHSNAVLGAMELCENAKLPWNIIPELTVSLELLKQYNMLLLPEVFVISKELAAIIKQYVIQGGKVIASSQSGLWNADSTKRDNSTIAEIIGADIIAIHQEYAQNNWSAYLTPYEGETFKGLLDYTTPPVSECFVEVTPTTAKKHLKFVLPCVSCSASEWVNWWCPPPGEITQMPALISNNLGNGTVYYTAFDFFTMAAAETYRYTDDLFRQLIDRCNITPSIRNITDTPLMLRTAFFENNEEYIIHQISMLPKQFKGQAFPISGGSLEITSNISSAEIVYPNKKSLEIIKADDKTIVVLPAFSLQQMIICKK